MWIVVTGQSEIWPRVDCEEVLRDDNDDHHHAQECHGSHGVNCELCGWWSVRNLA